MRFIPLAILALPLAACISFTPKPPPALMTLSNAAPLPPGPAIAAKAGASVTLSTLSAPPELGGMRVPVKAGPNAIAYLKGAQWADAPARLFRTLLAETITAKTSRVILDPRQYMLSPGARLSGRLSDFGLDAGSGQVTATFDATLIRKEGAPLETRRFQAHAPAARQDAAGVAAALSRASNQIAGEVAEWVGTG